MTIERTNDPNEQRRCAVPGCSALTTGRVKLDDKEHVGCGHHSDEELAKASSGSTAPAASAKPDEELAGGD